ncbi:hypothetical protein [Mesorhizobium sp. B2-3-4]|uniref:hypothetical protein n=1 Tax=Mesorhizobium sp. B2-3-4 TaxID=2589959 RepID=UPI0011273CA9|nr:hypothetical protein [Mesorhizobium sp. B2-3-4]TPM39623.1 hypothetical protein FJ967_09080 [Mesorhizobium sp. B2-3-4]
MKPYDVRSEADLLAMESDNHPQDAGVWSIMNGEDHISLHPPVEGSSTYFIRIPRDQFNAIVDWYMADQPAARLRRSAS